MTGEKEDCAHLIVAIDGGVEYRMLLEQNDEGAQALDINGSVEH